MSSKVIPISDQFSDSTSDEDLVRRTQSGDTMAFSLLVDRHHRMILAYLGSRLNSSHEAEDLAQEVFLTAFRKFDSFEPGRPVSAWLRGIALNHLRNHLRKFRPQYLGGSEELEHLLVDRMERANPDFPLLDALRDCLERLDGPTRELLVKRYEEGRSVKEIAQELGRGYSAVNTQIHRVRGALAECLQKRNPEETRHLG